MVKKYTLFNNIRVGEIIADSINLEPHNVIPKIHDVINGADASEVYIVEEFKAAPAAALPAAAAANDGYYFQTTGDNKLYFGKNSAWEEVAVENGDRYFLFNNAAGSIYKVTTATGTVGAASAEAISNTNDTIALNNRDKKAWQITVAVAGNTAFNVGPTPKSTAIEKYSYAGVRKIIAGRTNIHLFRLNSDGFSEKESTLKKLDRVTIINLDGTYFESHLLADAAASGLTLNGAAAASTNKNSVSLKDDSFKLTASLADISTESNISVVASRAGTIKTITSKLGGAITGADAILSFTINGTDVTGGDITVANAGSAVGDTDTSNPTAANVVAAGDVIKFASGGQSTGTQTISVVIELEN